ncbi:MAG TPA: hypothetical protein VF636_10360 [Sphingomonas sp.]|jgi:hypothetical protein
MTRPLLPLAATATALASLLPDAPPTVARTTVVWPTRWEGRTLRALDTTPADNRLAAGFPGHLARFSDGSRQVVLRRVDAATRQLHPARACFEGLGYRVAPSPMRRSGAAYSSCFEAHRDGEAVRVCERVLDADGRSFPDVSSWYWSALLGRSRGPWLATMVVERVR